MKKFTIALDADDVPAPYIEPGRKALWIDPRRITDWSLNKTDLTPGGRRRRFWKWFAVRSLLKRKDRI